MSRIIVKVKDLKKNKGRDVRYLFVKDESVDFHSHWGVIPKDALKNAGSFKTKDAELFIMNPSFADLYARIKRTAQKINIKDLGYILLSMGVNKDSVVVDAGTGSAASALYAAAISKKVYSFDVNEDRVKIAKKNAEMLGLRNVLFKVLDIYDGEPPVKNADAFILDVSEPWRAFMFADKSLKIGGFLAVYSPCITQVMQTIDKAPDTLFCERTVEISERYWKVKNSIVRPDNTPIGHTAFITIFRKIK